MADKDRRETQRKAEQKRRRRELIAVAVAALTFVVFVLAQTEMPPLSRHSSLFSNLAIITVTNLSILLLGLLLFLVGRNLAKVIFERRRGLIGSKLQVRLVAGFIAVAIVPSVFLLYVSGTFLDAQVRSWFNPSYERGLYNSLEIARTYYLNSANNASHFARVLAGQIGSGGLMAGERREELKSFVTRRQQEYNLGTIEVFSADRRLLLFALSPRTPTGIGASPDSPLITATLKGHAMTRTDRLGKSDVIRGAAPIYSSPESDRVIGAVVVDYYLPRSLAARAAAISRTSEDYFQLKILRQPILHSYILALVMIGLVVVTLASWFGIYLARGITVPINRLATGTQAVAAGDLNYRIERVGDDEIGHLVQSFNQMTADLAAFRAEIVRRRRYIETLLRNVPAGVVGLDPEGRVTMINPSTERLLGLSAPEVTGRTYREAFSPALRRALTELYAAPPRSKEARTSVRLERAGGDIELTVTLSPIVSETGEPLGAVLFLEDVSQIAKVERMEAWREVARRIAHEIKNPLTPIQLSAERMRRQLKGLDSGPASLVEECTRTIIGEVDDLKRLVNEFSGFARMPHVQPVVGDLNELAEEAVGNFRTANPAVEFELELKPGLPPVEIDREAVKRALRNVIDNAVSAAIDANHNGGRPQVRVRSIHDPGAATVSIEISDNGRGIDPRIRGRIFEPYVTSRKDGTGLGLAIVSAILSDHHGSVTVRDNQPGGSSFILEFPVQKRDPRVP